MDSIKIQGYSLPKPVIWYKQEDSTFNNLLETIPFTVKHVF